MQKDFITTLDNLSRNRTFREGEVLAATEAILKESALALGCERVNTWIFNEERDKISSYRAYDKRTDEFSSEGVLSKKELPNYFEYLLKEEIIVSNEAKEALINKELVDIYINPLQITAMIDVPIRFEGNMIGLVCFEHVNKTHRWTIEEKKFTLSISNLLSLVHETNRRRMYQAELERIINEKVILISEVNHRVKNNMTVILSLINLQRHKCKDEFHDGLFEDLSNRIYSMSEIQQQLHISQNFSEINIQTYLLNLIENLKATYGADKNIETDISITPITLDITKAIPCGLIVNEILSNSFKYAFGSDNTSPKLTLKVEKQGKMITLLMKDNGPGIQVDNANSEGMGRDLIESLTEQIEGEIEIDIVNGTSYMLTFTI